ncbi:MAG: DUF805 domain-containing protein [Sphingobacterium sp.]|uniref:DUF805 domain-containing protein n=1 Tax=Sphingobacterium sp. JB170 TaxID=1434842 RepID=UPI00097F2975|nr:DUF805 domain-containing protein [Sphingobacterium sp. JB170]SJN21281.1 Integral membrane protein [Sphingobacterium sp. JB170]
MDWFINNVKENYANFEGRARRKEYWTFVLCVWLLSIALALVGWILGIISSSLGGLITALSGLVSLALLIPVLAVGVRRLHDTGKPTWYIVFLFIPFVNLYFLYLMLIDGDRGPNEYGPDPKGRGGNDENTLTNFPPTPTNGPD